MAWSKEQIRNASVIASVGRSLGASQRDIVIALTAAIVESELRNVNYGDRDSLGLFQQRSAWGSAADRTDPAKAARMFFTGGQAGQRGLFDIHNRNSMLPGAAAQAVQVSAFPGRYQEHLAEAQQLLGARVSTTMAVDDTLGRVPALDAMVRGVADRPVSAPSMNLVDPNGESTADAAGIGEVGGIEGTDPTMAQTQAAGALDEMTFDGAKPLAPDSPSLDDSAPTGGGGGGGGGGGVNYAGFSGGNDLMADLHIPGVQDLLDQAGGGGAAMGGGLANSLVANARKMLGTPYVWGGTSPSGVDCSGLIQLLFKQQGISMPRISADQARAGSRIGLDQLQPGDLVAEDNSSRNNGADHIALYIGNGQIIEAPHPGGVVQVAHVSDMGGGAWGVRLPFAATSGETVGRGPGDWGAQLNVAAAGHKIAEKFGIQTVGGFNDRNIAGTSKTSDHAYGLALDFMGGKQDLADYVVHNAPALNVKYAIYNHHIWSAERADEGWRPYDGENPHTDHVHVSFYPDGQDPFATRTQGPSRSGTRRPTPEGAYDTSLAPIGWDDRYPDGGMGHSAHPVAHNSGAGSANQITPKSHPTRTPDHNSGAGSANAMPAQKSKPKPRPPRRPGRGPTAV